MKRLTMILFAAVVLLAGHNFARGIGGGGGYVGSRSSDDTFEARWEGIPTLRPEAALKFITIEGTAEIRVAPEEIRVVLAITSEGTTADECQTKNENQIKAVLEEWTELRIPDECIVTDFINVLPRYEWRSEDRDGQKVGIQKLAGYRMQTNLHVLVKTEQQAMTAINRAFQHGVTDIVSFDYWSSQLDEQKLNARRAALEIAKQKADTLLAVFDEPPKVINIQESTAACFPRSMYRTVENVLEEKSEFLGRRQDAPQFKAYRPKMTFLDGLQSQSDDRPAGIVMRPEIAVVSTVRLYFQSPAD